MHRSGAGIWAEAENRRDEVVLEFQETARDLQLSTKSPQAFTRTLADYSFCTAIVSGIVRKPFEV